MHGSSLSFGAEALQFGQGQTELPVIAINSQRNISNSIQNNKLANTNEDTLSLNLPSGRVVNSSKFEKGSVLEIGKEKDVP